MRDVAAVPSPQLTVAARLNTNECPLSAPAGVRATSSRTRSRRSRSTGIPTADDATPGGAGHAVGHPFEGTWAANGSNEILTQLLQAYGGPGRRAACSNRRTLLHARIAWLTQTEVVSLTLGDDSWLIGGLRRRAAITRDPDVVFVCSPNNPTGNAQPVDVVASPRRWTDALVIVDEAYIEFGGETPCRSSPTTRTSS